LIPGTWPKRDAAAVNPLFCIATEDKLASISRTTLSFRVFGDDLDPDEISRLLGVIPSKSYRKGEVRKTPNGGEFTANTGAWILSAKECSPGNLSAQIIEVLSRLTFDLSVWANLGQRYRCDLFSGLFLDSANEGEELSVEAMSMMVERRLKLGLDIYSSNQDDHIHSRS
jgi:hypothetical protein